MRFIKALYIYLLATFLQKNHLVALLADHFYQHALWPLAIKFAVKDLLPRAKVELASRNRDQYLPAHDLPL
jgi:hypothetical protein